MIPANSHGDLQYGNSRREINGARPSPLKINKGSHFIHKPSSNMSAMSTSLVASVAPARQQQQQQQRQPVIIYTHSPKIIHTQARDFMALVQKLTGVSSRSNKDDETETAPHDDQPQKGWKSALSMEGNDPNVKNVNHDDNESSSALTDENSGGGGGVGDVKGSSSCAPPNIPQTNQYLADIPLFTPNTTNFFCSPRPVHRYPDSAYVSPNMGGSMSPSLFEFMKGLPEY